MQHPLFKRKVPTLKEIQERRDKRNKGLHGVIKVGGIIFLVLAAVIISMLLLSPVLELHKLEQERELALQQLQQAMATETEARNKFQWMSDPEYFEQIARDRANQAKEGETIVRSPTAEERQQMEQEARKRRPPRKPRRRD